MHKPSQHETRRGLWGYLLSRASLVDSWGEGVGMPLHTGCATCRTCVHSFQCAILSACNILLAVGSGSGKDDFQNIWGHLWRDAIWRLSIILTGMLQSVTHFGSRDVGLLDTFEGSVLPYPLCI
jgi:hypothetical protein